MIIILLRHGSYDTEGDSKGHLSKNGVAQIEAQIHSIMQIINGRTENITLISSTAFRAIESMEVITKALQLPYRVEDKLLAQNGHPHDFPWLAETIKAEQALGTEVLLCVTHLEYVNDFPYKEARTELGIKGIVEDCRHGQGVVLNLITKGMRNLW